ncbi:MAG: hypothetical protein MJ090_00330 [Clostridia bacterium]|nr:hypothetical protein [Clostridia bacterium]
MNIAIYSILLFTAFLTGFILGFSFPFQKKSPVLPRNNSMQNDLLDFSELNREYRNFLDYDGTKQ